MAKKTPNPKVMLDTLRSNFGGPTELDEPRPLEQIVLLILTGGSDIVKARSAMKRLQSEYVDWNEVRVTSAYELRKWMRGLGAKKSQEKAEQVKELLSTVYNRFNKLNLDFLHKETKSHEDARKRERFQSYLQDKSLALHAMMTLHGSEKIDIVVQSGVARVLQRLGYLNGKTSTVTVTRAKIRDLFPAEDLILGQWGLYALLERYCHARSPDCRECPLLRHCSVGAVEVKKRAAADKKAAEIAKKKAVIKAAAEKKAAAIAKKKEAKRVAAEKKAAAAAAKKVAAELARRKAAEAAKRKAAAAKTKAAAAKKKAAAAKTKAAAAKKKAAAAKKKAAAAKKKAAAAKKKKAAKSTTKKKAAKKPARKKPVRKPARKAAKKPVRKAAKKSGKKPVRKATRKPAPRGSKKSAKKKATKKPASRAGKRSTRRR